jgi:hypothetical protein
MGGEMIMRIAMILAAALLSGGCVSMGTNYDPIVAQNLQLGTSEAEAIQRLGQPNNVTVLADVSRNLMWLHSTGNALGQAKARSVILRFDQQGRYTGMVSSTQTQIN